MWRGRLGGNLLGGAAEEGMGEALGSHCFVTKKSQKKRRGLCWLSLHLSFILNEMGAMPAVGLNKIQLAFLENLKADPKLQEKLRTASGPDVVIAVAKEAGINTSVEELRLAYWFHDNIEQYWDKNSWWGIGK